MKLYERCLITACSSIITTLLYELTGNFTMAVLIALGIGAVIILGYAVVEHLIAKHSKKQETDQF